MSKSTGSKIKSLEAQVKSLQSSLDSKELLLRKASMVRSEKEQFLEQQIAEANKQIEAANTDIINTSDLIKDLQNKLTVAEEKAVEDRLAADAKRMQLKNSEDKQNLIDAVHNVVGSGDRETHLRDVLEKAKADKEKAIRVLIKIAGKDKIADFLSHNAGSPDLLDRLEEMLLSSRSPVK